MCSHNRYSHNNRQGWGDEELMEEEEALVEREEVLEERQAQERRCWCFKWVGLIGS